MTATRDRISTFLGGQDVEIPSPADNPTRFYCALDTGLTYFSDGTQWLRVSAIGAPPAAQHSPATLDYDTGNASQWRLAQVKGDWSLTYSDTTRRIASGFSARFEVRPGDDPLNLGAGTERAEVLGPFFDEGDEVYVGWSTYFPNDTPTGEFISVTPGTTGAGKTNSISTFHENRGAQQQFATSVNIPPMEWTINSSVPAPYLIRLRVSGGQVVNNVATTPPTFYTLQDPVLYNQWNDFIVHVIHSSDPAIGGFEMWMNGSRPASVPSWQTLATKYVDRQTYFKQGWYRQSNPNTSVCYHDMTKMDSSKAAVDPARFD